MNLEQLKADVCQSRLIEGLGFNDADPLSIDHVAAAKYTYNQAMAGTLPDPRTVQAIMLRNDPTIAPRHLGQYRDTGVVVGPKNDLYHCPQAQYVPKLMEAWERVTCQFINTHEEYEYEELVSVADGFYFHFLCIHPLIDGNGRTGRLMRNATRILVGIPWDTITIDMNPLYTKYLREHQNEFFVPRYQRYFAPGPASG